MAGRNIIWCQMTEASDIADLAPKAYTNVIMSALHLHCKDGDYDVDLNRDWQPEVIPFTSAVQSQVITDSIGVLASSPCARESRNEWDCR